MLDARGAQVIIAGLEAVALGGLQAGSNFSLAADRGMVSREDLHEALNALLVIREQLEVMAAVWQRNKPYQPKLHEDGVPSISLSEMPDINFITTQQEDN